ncbi:MAG: CoA-binding protein [Aggregatilineales bacterium]
MMSNLRVRADEFLSQKRIAVAGVSRTEQDSANIIYKKLRDTGYQVFAINPNAEEVEGDPCYPTIGSIPDGIENVVIVTTPEVTDSVVRDCADAGVKRVWMHRSLGNSVSDDAVEFCRQHGIQVLDGGCPMMFCEPVDFGHKCLRTVMGWAGRLPK